MNNTVKLSFKKATLVAISAGMLTTSTMTSCSSMSDATKTKTQGTALGALGGALLGAGIGKATGGDTKAVLIGAAAGAVLGGIAGYAWGNSIVKEKSEYATMEEYVSDNKKQLDNRIGDVQKANTNLSKQIAQLKKDKTSVAKAEVQKQNAQLAQNISLIDADLATAQDAAKEASGAELAELSAKIDTLSAEKKSMQANLEELDSLASI